MRRVPIAPALALIASAPLCPAWAAGAITN
jgi:hypothetical protein